MSRDPSKLKVFAIADELVVRVYQASRRFPVEERFGLQSQIRRAAVSVAANIVEGAGRRTLRDYVHFLGVARASASEVRYLLGLSERLGLLDHPVGTDLASRYGDVVRGLQSMIASLEQLSDA